MTNSKNTRKALITSMLALLLCFTMLLGTTFAWFTDSVSSTGNKIQAGTLKVDLIDENKNSVAGGTLDFVTADGRTTEILWEPGCTYYLTPVYVENDGNLALKYKVSLNLDEFDGDAELLNVLNWYVLDHKPTSANDTTGAVNLDEFEGTLEAGNVASKPLVIVVHMSEDAGNEYQGKSISNVSITVVATQASAESDSFDNTYDENATYDNTYDENATATVVSTAAELVDAIANGGNIVLASDIVVSKQITLPKGEEVVLDLGGNTLSGAFENEGGSAVIYNQGTLTVKNGTIVSLAEYPDVDWGTEGYPTYATNTITNRGTLTIEEGAVIENQTATGGASYAIDNQYSWAGVPSVLTVNGGTITAKDVAIRLCASTADYDNTVIINGGTITGKRAVWIQLTGSDSAVAPKATLTINGGTLTKTGENEPAVYSYSYGNSFANTKVTITDGIFNGDVQFGGGYKGDQETVIITGGTFNGYLGRWLENDGWENIAKPEN